MASVSVGHGQGAEYHLNPLHLLRHLWRQRDLIRQFTRREIEGRYRGSYLGLIWSFINPLILLLIYTFVFGVVFQSRWPQARSESLAEFALVLFCGLIPFNLFSECVSRAPSIIIGVPNYVKKVVFPLEILAVSSLGTGLFHALITLSVLLAVNLVVSGVVQWTLVLLPLVLLPLIFLSLGLGWLFASLGVFLRDIGYVVTLLVQVLFFITPIFYPTEAIPEPFQTVIRYNPLTFVVDSSRAVVLWGKLPDWLSLGVWLLGSAVVMQLGYAWFMKTKKGFADVI
ncbi:MAG TPA: ABC transporter permease [Roseiflexaceae bacterium]|nr:ABC transporter permease [Roseiflexaceae bacterium]